MHGRYGTTYIERDGLLARVVDRTGAVHGELAWALDAREARSAAIRAVGLARLARLEVTGAVVEGAVIAHPLLGAAHAVGATAVSAIEWARPEEIPAIAEPGRLPLGAGAAILNMIAVVAARAGVAGLRYAGPYPTAALWKALGRSFRAQVGATEAEFTAGGLDRALRVDRTPIAIDFAPAPHERVAIAGGFVELREGVERAVIDGVAFEVDGSPARLSVRDGVVECDVWFGGVPYARVATLAADGRVLGGPHAIAACTSAVIGRVFPDPLRIAIGELVAEAVPAPLADDVRALCAATPLVWADLGARAARETADGFAVHAALWERIAPLGLGRLALALAEALAPVVTAAAVRRASPPLASTP
jgi:hypothetical protein